MKRDALGSFWRILAPRPVSLVTCVDREGKPNIITVAWTTPLSIRPPLLAIAVGEDRHSRKLISETRQFVVNVPTRELAEKVQFCGSVSGRTVDKFKESGLTASPAKRVKPPIIEECVAHLECELVNEVPAGDHVIFIGKVVAAYAEEEAFVTQWRLERVRPLLHVGGRRYSEPGPAFEVG